MTEPLTRVSVVDDDPFARKIICELLNAQNDLTVASSYDDGQALIDDLDRDVVPPTDVYLCDISMPQLNGIETTKAIRDRGNSTPVMLLTSYDVEERFMEGMQAGANGYLIKTSDISQIRAAILSVATGTAVFSPDAAGFSRTVAAHESHGITPGDLYGLTEREEAILTQLCRGQSNYEIARYLGISEGTVKVHITSIMKKANVRSRLELVVHAFNSGVVQPMSPDRPLTGHTRS